MKIGIVTFQRADNQGALLQCYALYSYLKKLERNTEVIDYRNNNIEKAYKIFPISKNIKLMARKWLKGIRRYGELKKRHENFERLRKKISFSPSINISDIRKIRCNKHFMSFHSLNSLIYHFTNCAHMHPPFSFCNENYIIFLTFFQYQFVDDTRAISYISSILGCL